MLYSFQSQFSVRLTLLLILLACWSAVIDCNMYFTLFVIYYVNFWFLQMSADNNSESNRSSSDSAAVWHFPEVGWYWLKYTVFVQISAIVPCSALLQYHSHPRNQSFSARLYYALVNTHAHAHRQQPMWQCVAVGAEKCSCQCFVFALSLPVKD